MTESNKWQARFNKTKTSLIKNWKRTALFSVAFLAVGGVGVAVGSHMGHDYDGYYGDSMGFGSDYDSLSNGNWSSNSSLNTVMTYDGWTEAVNRSSLSSADKETFLNALEKAKDNIDKASDLQTQIEKLYTDSIQSLESRFASLIGNNSGLWAKVEGAGYYNSLADISIDDITDLKQEVNESSLSDSEKSTLLADLETLKVLKEEYSTAYASYIEKSSDLKDQLETAENAVQTVLKDNSVTSDMISEVLGVSDDVLYTDSDNSYEDTGLDDSNSSAA